MTLKGTFVGLEGLGSGGSWLGDNTEYFTGAKVNELRRALYLFANGAFYRTMPIGGSKTIGLRYSGAIDAVDAVEFSIDNTGNYVSGSTGVVIPISVLCRVEDPSIAVTPRIYNMTLAEVATTSGSAACVATDETYAGTAQRQTLLLTLPTGVNVFKLQFVATAADYQFWGQGWRSLYI